MKTPKGKSAEGTKLRKLLNEHSGTKEKRLRTRILHHLRFEKPRYWWKERRVWQKICLLFITFVMLVVGSMYGIAQWYLWKHRGEPLEYGVTFSPDYAAYFGMDPQDTMRAILGDLGVRHLRLVSYWDDIEATKGTYDFSQLDWQFKQAEAAGAKISLAVGLRQPRWPECHQPGWVNDESKDVWYPQLKNVMSAVIERYKNSPALETYQLENEFFLTAFGECKDFDRQRLIEEFNLVKKLDPNHQVIVSRSNNAIGFPVGQPTPDKFGVSVYKRVWDRTITKRYFEYPFPAWFYAFLAGGGEILTGKDMIIHELQAEAWLPDGYDMRTAPLSELYKSMNPQRLHDRFEYGRASGMHTVDAWGVEWWYYVKVHYGNPDLWNAAKEEFTKYQYQELYR
ncbi:MAG TPA: hypothetical protein VLE69_02335 [Candidatus Saccharimonadales bacterium]|nr:hypothetical protein [Candidatus Saccharimonadales bacterium]